MLLDEPSSRLVAINTTKGLFRYTWLPFDVASAPVVFQKSMETILQGIPRVICYLDDILVTRCTETEHVSNLEEALSRLQAHGVRGPPKKGEMPILSKVCRVVPRPPHFSRWGAYNQKQGWGNLKGTCS